MLHNPEDRYQAAHIEHYTDRIFIALNLIIAWHVYVLES